MQSLPKYINRSEDQVLYSGLYWNQNEINAIIDNIQNGKWFASGENVHKFEKQFSSKFNFKQSLMVNSGSSANLIMLAALKKKYQWKDEDEIIVSPVGFPTTISSIVINKLKPVFIDITFDDLNWNINLIEQKITSKTKALLSSPVLGNPYNIDSIVNLCNKHGLMLISDNCDSLGSKWNNKYLTDYSTISSCSFYASHHISTGEGGMVSSNDKELIAICKSMANWGRDCWCYGANNLLPNGTCKKRFSKWLPNYNKTIDHKYIYSNLGFNLKPLDLQGAIGSVQLEKIDEIIQKRRYYKQYIQNLLEQYILNIRVINEQKNAFTSWFGIPIICNSYETKTKLVKYLEENKIQTRNYFAGNILQHPGYSFLDDALKYTEANKVLDLVFFIGCAPYYTEKTLNYIEKKLQNFKGK